MAKTKCSGIAHITQKLSGDPNPQYFSKSIAVQMGGVLPYKWEAYCSTNGRRIAGFPFLRSLEARKARRYKWGTYCRTNWRCTAVLFRQAVGVGVSETLTHYNGEIIHVCDRSGQHLIESILFADSKFQQFRRVTSMGSLPPKTSENPADPRRTPQRPRRTLGETPQSPRRDPRRALWEANFLGEPRGGLCPSDGDPPEL